MAGRDCADAGRRTGAWRAPGERRTGGGHGATCRALAVGQGRGQAATGGSRARRSAPRRRAMDAGSVTTARTVMRPAHPVQRLTSTSKVGALERGPIDAGKRRVELAAKESVPVRDGEDVRGHRKRRPRHEERRRWHSRSVNELLENRPRFGQHRPRTRATATRTQTEGKRSRGTGFFLRRRSARKGRRAATIPFCVHAATIRWQRRNWRRATSEVEGGLLFIIAGHDPWSHSPSCTRHRAGERREERRARKATRSRPLCGFGRPSSRPGGYP